ncbi:MAG TPA: hypothetical protein VFB26_01910 [Gaiellaceae bacterium]|nr:hypothetical protein [Gaiellaceae bacterium]
MLEDPGRAGGFDRGGWAFRLERGPERDRLGLDELPAGEALLPGRRTNEGFAATWPSRTDEVSALLEHGLAEALRVMVLAVVLGRRTALSRGRRHDRVPRRGSGVRSGGGAAPARTRRRRCRHRGVATARALRGRAARSSRALLQPRMPRARRGL